MATIKIPYTYTKYEGSKLATWADKRVQSSSGILMFADFFFFWSLAAFIVFVSPDLDALPQWVALVQTALLLVFFLVAPIGAPFILRAIWNKRRWNDKLALIDIARRQDKELNRKFKMGVALLIAVLLLPFVLDVILVLVRDIAL